MTNKAYAIPCGCWDAPWWADALVGTLTAQLTVPIAALCWIARLVGVEVPFYS